MKTKRLQVSFIGTLVAVALVMLMLASSCSSPIASPKTAQPPKPSATTTASAAPTSADANALTLKFSVQLVDRPGAAQDSLRKYADQIDVQTQGRVKLKIFWGAVLGKVQDTLKFVGQSNVADGAFVVTTYHQWEIPLTAAAGLPFFTTGYNVGYKATQSLYNEWPAMQDEWAKANMIPVLFFQPHEHWMGITIPIKSMDDLKGKKMWVGGFWPDLVTQFGVGSIPLSTPEAYEGLQKGLIMGIINPYQTFRDSKFAEFTKYMVKWPFGGQPVNAFAFSRDAWKKISPADQKTILAISAQVPEWMVAAQDVEKADLDKYFKDQGCQTIDLGAAEYARIASIGRPAIYNPWLATAKEKGVPGQEFIDRYTAKVKEFSK